MCLKTVICRKYRFFMFIAAMAMDIYISTSLKLLDSTRTINAEAAELISPAGDGICASLARCREDDHGHVILRLV